MVVAGAPNIKARSRRVRRHGGDDIPRQELLRRLLDFLEVAGRAAGVTVQRCALDERPVLLPIDGPSSDRARA